MDVLTTVTVLLTLFTSLRVVCTQCVVKKVCDDPLEILKSMKADPDNYQQLLNAFYPINRAKPSSVIIAYFTNYTGPLPEECSLGTYPWRTYPGINYTYHSIHWYMWTTTPIHCMGTNFLLLEFGEYLPTLSFYLQFNKSSPFYSPSQIACIKTHLIPHGNPTLGDVTTQILSVISGKLQRQYEEKSSGVLYMNLLFSTKLGYDVRVHNYMPQGTQPLGIPNRGFYALLVTMGLLAPFLLYTKGGQLIKSLQQSRSKAKVPFFWAVASLAHVFTVYMMIKVLIITCHPYGQRHGDLIMSCTGAHFTIGFQLVVSLVYAYVHSKHITLPIPIVWSRVTKCTCCVRNPSRIITTISLWAIYMGVASLLGCIPFQLLLVSANPHLYGFGILTVWCAMFVCIMVTSIPFTIDLIFIKEGEYRISLKQAFQQTCLLMFIAVFVFGFGSLSFSITLVLHLSKYGEETQSFTKSVYFVLRYTALPIASWMIQVLYHKVKLEIRLIFQRQNLQ